MATRMASDEVTDGIAAIEMHRQGTEKESGLAAACSEALRKLHALLEQEKEALQLNGPDAGYSANVEMARTVYPEALDHLGTSTIKEVKTPGLKTVEEVAVFLKLKPSEMMKTLIYLRDGGVVVALIAGDLELNEVKLKNVTGAEFLTLADVETIRAIAESIRLK